VLVVDASVLTPALADSGRDGRQFRGRLRGEVLCSPDLVRVEVTSALRRHVHLGRLTAAQATRAMADLVDLPITVFPTAPLLRRVWQLRENLTAYDGCYVALAEALSCPMLTADHRLARAPRVGCTVEVL